MAQAKYEFASFVRLGFDMMRRIEPLVTLEIEKDRVPIRLDQKILKFFPKERRSLHVNGVLARYIQLKAEQKAVLGALLKQQRLEGAEAIRRNKSIWFFLENISSAKERIRAEKRKVWIVLDMSIKKHFVQEYQENWQTRINDTLLSYVTAKYMLRSKFEGIMPLNSDLGKGWSSFVFGSEIEAPAKKKYSEYSQTFNEEEYELAQNEHFYPRVDTDRFVCIYCEQALFRVNEFHNPMKCYFNSNLSNNSNFLHLINCGKCGKTAFKYNGSDWTIHEINKCSLFPNVSTRTPKYVPLFDADASALYILGLMYCRGDGVSKNDMKASELLFEAARKGHSSAAFIYESLYTDIDPRETEEVHNWYREAAEQGYTPAQHNMAYMYFEGKLVEQDYEKAREIWQKAAYRGYAPSQVSLGAMYALGLGIEPDLRKARKWYRLAAKQGDARAIANLKALDEKKSGKSDKG